MGGLPTDRTIYAVHSHPKTPRQLLAALQEGLYKSEDAGKTWQKVDLPMASHIVAFTHDPEDPALLFAATGEGGILKSTDGGARWTRQH
ncbi:MAG: WD40/YVTN/BNR-like repeat-containing protein [Candidatus Entotheonellia bacterium]